jgi:hypothetical protein
MQVGPAIVRADAFRSQGESLAADRVDPPCGLGYHGVFVRLHSRQPFALPRTTERGPVAQLGARMNGIHEVTGSIPVWSTILRSRESNAVA